ncbi:MAG: methyl-accepting chemotaxis protein [Rhodospirillales bacterium]|nr:methyl-accepting chemotaxis protein [Rhodospirillales bacterium]
MRFTIGRKITSGMLVILVMLLVVGVIAWQSSSKASKGVQEVAEMMHDTSVGGEAMSDMLMVRMNVKDFLINNLDKDIEEYDQWKAAFLEDVAACEKSFQNPDRKKWVAEIQTQFVTYDATFDQVKEIIKQRNETIDTKLNVLGPKIAADVKAYNYEAIENDKANARQLAQIAFDLFEGRLYLMKYLKTSREEDYQRSREEFNSTLNVIDQVIKDESDPDFRARLVKTRGMIEEYVVAFNQVHDLVKERNVLVLDTLDQVGPQIASLGKQILESLAQSGSEVESSVTQQVQRSQLTIIGIVAVAMVIGIVASLLITRAVVKPISNLVERIKDISQGEGDLTQRVDEDRSDELGELGQWFNTFVRKIHDIIVELSSVTREVSSSSTQIAASSEEMAAGMQQQSEQTTQVSSAVEEMSATVVEVARKSADAANTAEVAGKQANEGGQVVSQTVDGIRAIAGVVNESAAAINELGKRGEQIGQVIEVITDIADQTNLLALNAAIEAARAGEHGRGFAVVADEVRKLAERTMQATEEVATSIKAIQEETNAAVQRMSSGTEKVDEGVRLAESAGESLGSIVSDSKNVAEMIQSIAAASEEQSAASEEISRNVESINAVTRQSAEGAGQAAAAATQLSVKAEELQTLVNQFKTETT